MKYKIGDDYKLINFICPHRIAADVDDQEMRAIYLFERMKDSVNNSI